MDVKTANKTMTGHAGVEISPNRPHQLKEVIEGKFSRYGVRAGEVTTTPGLNYTPTNKTSNNIPWTVFI